MGLEVGRQLGRTQNMGFTGTGPSVRAEEPEPHLRLEVDG